LHFPAYQQILAQLSLARAMKACQSSPAFVMSNEVVVQWIDKGMLNPNVMHSASQMVRVSWKFGHSSIG
jgi:hypothetical protein